MTAAAGAEKGRFDAGVTSRVTPVGQILPKWKLDELPQLWNVLIGDMSLVGPRPEIRKWVEAYPERWAKVLTVRPGITDPASIEFRNEEDLLAAAADPERHYRKVVLPQKLEFYEEYVQTRSFWGDLGIVFKTFFVLVRNS
jgi:lipopolysaccharide/colanic/teichoic acid biosynthesis glycosyltransferase